MKALHNYKKLYELDKDLFDLIMGSGLGVSENSLQNIRWFIHTSNPSNAEDFQKGVQDILPLEYAKKFSTEITENEQNFTILVHTPEFVFNLNNITTFSKILFDLSFENSCSYDFWEAEVIDQSDGSDN